MTPVPPMGDDAVQRVRLKIAALLADAEREFAVPMQVTFIAHDPANSECSFMLSNAAPGRLAESVTVAAGLLKAGGVELDDPDRASTWDVNRLADVMIGAGGIAVWVRRGEGAARARLRFGGDFQTVVMELAHLRVGLDELLASMAQKHNVPLKDLRGVVDAAYRTLKDHTESVTRITPVGDGT